MPKAFSLPHRLLVMAATSWLLLILLAVLLREHGTSLLYLAFRPICHQLPERSFSMSGTPLPVCARCLGIYLGFWLGAALLPWMVTLSSQLLQKPRTLALFFVPMAIDVLMSNSHVSRFLTGAIAGFPVALFVLVAAEQIGPTLTEHFGRRRTP